MVFFLCLVIYLLHKIVWNQSCCRPGRSPSQSLCQTPLDGSSAFHRMPRRGEASADRQSRIARAPHPLCSRLCKQGNRCLLRSELLLISTRPACNSLRQRHPSTRLSSLFDFVLMPSSPQHHHCIQVQSAPRRDVKIFAPVACEAECRQ